MKGWVKKWSRGSGLILLFVTVFCFVCVVKVTCIQWIWSRRNIDKNKSELGLDEVLHSIVKLNLCHELKWCERLMFGFSLLHCGLCTFVKWLCSQRELRCSAQSFQQDWFCYYCCCWWWWWCLTVCVSIGSCSQRLATAAAHRHRRPPVGLPLSLNPLASTAAIFCWLTNTHWHRPGGGSLSLNLKLACLRPAWLTERSSGQRGLLLPLPALPWPSNPQTFTVASHTHRNTHSHALSLALTTSHPQNVRVLRHLHVSRGSKSTCIPEIKAVLTSVCAVPSR